MKHKIESPSIVMEGLRMGKIKLINKNLKSNHHELDQ